MTLSTVRLSPTVFSENTLIVQQHFVEICPTDFKIVYFLRFESTFLFKVPIKCTYNTYAITSHFTPTYFGMTIPPPESTYQA
jgi:hypothetical protein